ncbi:MAG: MFS transporter [Candidatus Sedimenticola sp. PURPLELP]
MLRTSRSAPPFWRRRKVVSWALYDVANSAFATTVMAGFFPVFFKQYWASDMSASESTFLLGNINAFASILVVALAPILGAIADHGGVKKRFLMFFTAMGIVMTGGLYLTAQGNWAMALTLYAMGVLGFSGSMIFYDALLINVAREKELDYISALGFSVGYLGGGVLFAFNVLMVIYPSSFGLPDAATAVRFSFISVAVWWALFSIPVFLFVSEPRPKLDVGWIETVRGGFQRLKATFHQVRALKQTFLFLLAYWCYIDGVDTIVRMAVDYGLALGFEANGLMIALLITQFVGFPAALFFGYLGERRGPRQGIMIAIFVYLLVILWAYRMESQLEFYLLAATIGLVQGGIQSLSRSFYARLIPRDQAGEFFGFYNMLGKFAAVLGPLIMGWVSVLTDSPRLSILAVAVLFIAGGILLAMVKTEEGQEQARLLEH